MSLDNIVAGDYGQVIELTFIDVDTDAAANISAYGSEIQMIFIDPNGSRSTKTATFKTDGSDGVIQYTIDSGMINMPGLWDVRGRVSSGSAILSTITETFKVRS